MAKKKIERRLVEILRDLGVALVTVESCTGGSIADRITQVPGSSEIFWGSFVAYQERAKVTALGVPARLLATAGPVSRRVAGAMASAGYRLAQQGLHCRVIAVSTTGVAGPGGGSARTPIGLCYIGVVSSRARGRARVVRVAPPRKALSRSSLKKHFADLALLEVLREVRGLNPSLRRARRL